MKKNKSSEIADQLNESYLLLLSLYHKITNNEQIELRDYRRVIEENLIETNKVFKKNKR